MYKDKEKQRQANKKWVRQKRAKDKGTTDQQLLQGWAMGKGNNYQQGLGVLAAQYNIIKYDGEWGRPVLDDAGWKPARMYNDN